MALRHDGGVATGAANDPVVRVRTTITLPRELHQRVRVHAIESQRSMEAVIEAAIVALLEAEPG